MTLVLTIQDRNILLEHITKNPERYWPTTWQWSFKNPTKVYGSPFIDAAIARSTGQSPRLAQILEELKSYKG